jgi:triacylglycerol esterase/lipase EstA (alpha/beta hydrolase family)
MFRRNLIHEIVFVNQVRQVVQRRRNLRKISFVAHSLGGLISRYAIGKLYEHSIGEEPHLNMDKHSDEDLFGSGKLAGLEPMNFITSATPHLGSRCNKQVRSRTI